METPAKPAAENPKEIASPATPHDDRSRRLTFFLLALLFLAGLALRTDGLDWSLPFRLHPDEWKYVSGAARVHMGEWNPEYFRNPPGFSYLVAGWYPLWLRICPPVEIPEWLSINQARIAPSYHVLESLYKRPFDLVYGARALSALFGAGTILLVYWLARGVCSRWGAVAAAGLLSVSFVSIRESHMGTNDAAAVFFALLALGCAIRLAARMRWAIYWAAFMAGIAVAVKYNAAPAVLAVMGCYALQRWRAGNLQWAPLFGQLVLLGLIAVLAFLLVCPFPITDPQTFQAEMALLSEAASKHWPGQDTRWSGIQLAESIWLSEGWLASAFALLGLGLLIYRRQWELLLFPLFYSLLVMTHPLYFVRFSLMILPWVAIAAVAGIETVSSYKTSSKRLQVGILVGLTTLCMAQPLTQSLRSNWLFQQTDTRIETLQWFRTEAIQPRLIVGDQYVLPLPYRVDHSPWGSILEPRFRSIEGLPSSQLEQLNETQTPVGYITLSSFVTFPGSIPDTYRERRKALMNVARAEEPMQVFQPYTVEWQPHASDVEDTYHPVRRLWQREQPGPAIEVYAHQLAK